MLSLGNCCLGHNFISISGPSSHEWRDSSWVIYWLVAAIAFLASVSFISRDLKFAVKGGCPCLSVHYCLQKGWRAGRQAVRWMSEARPGQARPGLSKMYSEIRFRKPSPLALWRDQMWPQRGRKWPCVNQRIFVVFWNSEHWEYKMRSWQRST